MKNLCLFISNVQTELISLYINNVNPWKCSKNIFQMFCAKLIFVCGICLLYLWYLSKTINRPLVMKALRKWNLTISLKLELLWFYLKTFVLSLESDAINNTAKAANPKVDLKLLNNCNKFVGAFISLFFLIQSFGWRSFWKLFQCLQNVTYYKKLNKPLFAQRSQ